MLHVARALAVEGFVSRHLAREAVPGDVRARILAQRFYERSLLDAAEELSATLAAGNVPHFFVRGVALAGMVYALGDRELADIDAYVRPEDAQHARETLGRLRYREVETAQQSGPEALRPGILFERDPGRADFAGVAVDLHWGVEPVNRLLPRPDLEVPAAIWDRLATKGSIPVPAPEHHAALLVHHLVHHDMLHVRGLLDLALLWPSLPQTSGPEFEAAAARLGVLRAARALQSVLVSELGLVPLAGVEEPASDLRGKRLIRRLDLDDWLARAYRASLREHQAITPERVRLRVLLIDRLNEARYLVQDALWPPVEFLRWRWPGNHSLFTTRARHIARVWAKLLARNSAGE